MKLISKRTELVRRSLSLAEREAVIAYENSGHSCAQGELIIRLMNEVSDRELWLQCDCRSAEYAYPLVTVSKKPLGGLAWRTWANDKRPAHHRRCVFYGRLIRQQTKSAWDRPFKTTPAGYFSVLTRSGTADRAQSYHSPSPTGANSRPLPALAMQLLRLIAASQTNKITDSTTRPTLAGQQAKLHKAASSLLVAPGVALDQVLSTYPGDWKSRRIHARIRNVEASFPEGHRPQGFICFYCNDVTADRAVCHDKEGNVILHPTSGIRRPTIHRHQVPGPYLLFGVVGESDGSGYDCLRAYVQPIVGPNAFMAVDSHFERLAFRTLIYTHKRLSSLFSHLKFTLEKPIFEINTAQGPCIPDFIMNVRKSDRKIVSVPIEVMGFDRPSYLQSKSITHPRMQLLGPLLTMDGCVFESDLHGEGHRITQEIVGLLS